MCSSVLFTAENANASNGKACQHEAENQISGCSNQLFSEKNVSKNLSCVRTTNIMRYELQKATYTKACLHVP